MMKRFALLLAVLFVASMVLVGPVFASGNHENNNGGDNEMVCVLHKGNGDEHNNGEHKDKFCEHRNNGEHRDNNGEHRNNGEHKDNAEHKDNNGEHKDNGDNNNDNGHANNNDDNGHANNDDDWS